jgi:hypothetical protein
MSTKIYQNRGCKAVGKETARLTRVNETIVSKIWNRNPENSIGHTGN